MAENRNRDVIEVDLDDKKAVAKVDALQRRLDRLHASARTIAMGGGMPGGAPGGGTRGTAPPDHRTGSPAVTRAQSIAGGVGGAAQAGLAGGAGWAPSMMASLMGSAGAVFGPRRQQMFQGRRGTGGQGAIGAAAGAIEEVMEGFGGIGGGIPIVGGIMRSLSGLAQGALKLMSAGMQQRVGRVEQLMQITRQQGLSRLGGVGVSLERGAALGFAPGETAAMAQQFAAQRGTIGGTPNFLGMSLSGAGIGAMAQFSGLQARGAGALGGPGAAGANPRNQLSMAFAQGLRGANLDKWLQIIAGSTTQLAEQGIDTNLKGTENFMNQLRSTQGLEDAGLRLPRFAAQLAGTVGGARGGLLGGFQGLGQQAVMARAIRAGGGIRGAVRALEEGAAGPGGAAGFAREAITGQFGANADLIFASMGLTMGQAGAAAGPLARGRRMPGLPMAGGRELAIQGAMQQVSLLQSISIEDARGLLDDVHMIHRILDVMGKAGGTITGKLKEVAGVQAGYSKEDVGRFVQEGGSLRGYMGDTMRGGRAR